MKNHPTAGAHHHSEAEERRIREASLDETIEASFPRTLTQAVSLRW